MSFGRAKDGANIRCVRAHLAHACRIKDVGLSTLSGCQQMSPDAPQGATARRAKHFHGPSLALGLSAIFSAGRFDLEVVTFETYLHVAGGVTKRLVKLQNKQV